MRFLVLYHTQIGQICQLISSLYGRSRANRQITSSVVNSARSYYIPPGMTDEELQLTADAALSRADELFQARRLDQALEQYQAAQHLARDEFNRPIEVEALSQIARVFMMQGKKDEGRQWLDKASAIASESDPMGWSRFIGVRGRYQWRENDLQGARETFEHMYSFCSDNNLWSRAVDAANMNAIVADTPEDQIAWSRRGIEIAEKAEVDSWLGPLWNNLAATYFDIHQYDEALDCYLKARGYHWQHSDERSKLMADYQIGMTLRMLGKMADAARWLRPVLAWAERLEDHVAIAQAAQDLGEVEIACQRQTSGIALLRQALDAYRTAKYDEQAPEIVEQLSGRIKQLEG